MSKLKGGKTRKKSSKTGKMEMLPLPKTLVETHSSDFLEMNYLFVQGILTRNNIRRDYKAMIRKPHGES